VVVCFESVAGIVAAVKGGMMDSANQCERENEFTCIEKNLTNTKKKTTCYN
jgi:hypothetical protein